jgi:hypothetical protein
MRELRPRRAPLKPFSLQQPSVGKICDWRLTQRSQYLHPGASDQVTGSAVPRSRTCEGAATQGKARKVHAQELGPGEVAARRLRSRRRTSGAIYRLQVARHNEAARSRMTRRPPRLHPGTAPRANCSMDVLPPDESPVPARVNEFVRPDQVMDFASGDDGTRTHNPLLANLTAADLGERHGAHGPISDACGAG